PRPPSCQRPTGGGTISRLNFHPHGNPTMTTKAASDHRWQFVTTGGLVQIRLRDAKDLLALPSLDQKLWAALSCPTEGLILYPETRQDIDADGEGRVRAQELLGAIEWTGRMLKDPEVLVPGDATLQLSSINEADPEGKRLKASAVRILEALG